MRWGKLVVFIILLGAIVVFNLFFKDALIERGFESALESIFKARSDVKGLSFKLLKARIHFDYLEIADRDEPFKNLLELGSTEVDLKLSELLKRKVVIENIQCHEIKWNTDRASSGRLESEKGEDQPEEGVKIKEEKPEGAVKSLLSASLVHFDAERLIEEQKSKLQSLNKINSINESLTQSTERWSETLEDLDKDLNKASEGISKIKRIDFSSVKNIDDAKRDYERIEKLLPLVKDLTNDADRINRDIQKDLNTLDREIKEVSELIDRDYDYLKTLIRIPEGGVKGSVSLLVHEYLEKKLGRIYSYALKAKHYASRMREDSKEKKRSPRRRAGYDVPFPTTVYPKFLLENLEFSLGGKQDSLYFEANARDITSNPDLWDKPATYRLNLLDHGKELLARGFIDLRKNSEDTVGLELEANNYQFKIDEGLDLLKAESMRGVFSFKTDFIIDNRDETRGSAVIKVDQFEIEAHSEDDLIARIVYDTLQSTPNIFLSVYYKVSQPGNKLTLNIESNLDDEISKQIKSKMDDLMRQYEKKLKEELNKRLSPELKKNAELYSAFKQVERLAAGDKSQAAGFNREIEAKKEEYNSAVKKMTGDAQKKLKDAARKLKIPGI